MNRRAKRAAFHANWAEAVQMNIEIYQYAEALKMDKARDKAISRREAYLANPAAVNLQATLAGCAEKGLAASFMSTMPKATFARLTKK
jgi:hypothetical protein